MNFVVVLKFPNVNYKSLDQLVLSIVLFQLKLDSLRGQYFFIDFDWFHMLCGQISLASGICYLIFIGSLTVRLHAPGNRTRQIGQFRVIVAKLSYKYGLLRTNQIQAFCY